MAISRIQIASNKKSALTKQNMRDVALLLAEDPPREEKAKIRAEALIRDDWLIEAYEILQLGCELLHERIKLIDHSKRCPSDLVETVSTLIYASHRVDIQELVEIRRQFRYKYGKQFEIDALRNEGQVLNERVVQKLSVEPPPAYMVQRYLEKCCEKYQVDWTPAVRLDAAAAIKPTMAPSGYSVTEGQATGVGTVPAYEEKMTMSPSSANGSLPPPMVAAEPVPAPPGDFDEVDIFIPPAAPSAPVDQTNEDDDGDVPPPPPPKDTLETKVSSDPSYDDLAARFAKLSKK